MLTKSKDRFAVIDLGSNSFYMLLGSVLPSHNWQIEHEITEAVQLRAGLSQQGALTWESMNRALTCLDTFAVKLAKFAPDRAKVRIVGTAALRLANNRDLFLSHSTKILGYPIEIISGEEEAALIYQAFVRYLQNSQSHNTDNTDEKILGIDVGGGSTELVIGFEENASLSVSLPIGCIELAPYFLGKGGVNAESFALTKEGIKEQFILAENAIQNMLDLGWRHVYAGSGSADILAQISRFLGIGDGKDISLLSLTYIQEYLISLKDYQQVKVLVGLKDHQVSILPGIVAIFLALMTRLKLEKITILPVALRHGVLAAMRSSTLPLLQHNN